MSDIALMIVGLTVLTVLCIYIYMEHGAENDGEEDEQPAKNDQELSDENEK